MTTTMTNDVATDVPNDVPTDVVLDEGQAVATLVMAFSADPVVRWLYPEPARYLAFFPQLARLLGGDAFVAGTAEVAQGHAGTALWVSPDSHLDEEAAAALVERSVDEVRAEAVFALFTEVLGLHPTEPVWYLPFIGVDPAHQGRGIGGRLLAAGLARADRDGLPAYLEASTPRNRALYERHGFEVLAEVRAAGSPPLWPMMRPARGGSAR